MSEQYKFDDLDPLDAFALIEQQEKTKLVEFASVDTARLYGQEAADYFGKVDRRILIGFRAALELLNIPLPAYAVRRPPGPLNRLVREITEIDGERYSPERPR